MNESDPNSRTKHIYVDCTQTLASGLNTGVQRVVRNITHHLLALAETRATPRVVPVLILKGSVFELDPKVLGYRSNPVAGPVSVPVGSGLAIQGVDGFWRALLGWLRKNFGDIAARFLGRWARRIYFLLRTLALRRHCVREVNFLPLDTLLMIDLCTDLSLERPLRKAKDAGVTILVCHYDLIALNHAALCSPSWREAFLQGFHTSLAYADGYLCISKSVKEELASYLEQNFYADAGRIRCTQFTLGSDLFEPQDLLCSRQDLDRCVSPELQEFTSAHQYVLLMVGTIEPRKNHRLVLEMFTHLKHRMNASLGLIWIGRPGWRSAEIIQDLQRHEQFPEHIRWFSETSDRDLLFAYDHSHVLLFPSFAEGFGLPIVEAASRGCYVMASDIACHQEFNNPAIKLLPPTNPQLWVDHLEAYILSSDRVGSEARRSCQDSSLISWRQSAHEVFERILDLQSWPSARQICARHDQ